MGRSSTSTSTEPVTPAAAAGAMAVISLGEMLVMIAGWPPTSTVSARRKPMPWMTMAPPVEGRRAGRRCRHKAASHYTRSRGGRRRAHRQCRCAPGRRPRRDAGASSRPWRAVEAAAAPTAAEADRVESVPHADGGHGFHVGGCAGLVKGLGNHGEGAVGAHGKVNQSVWPIWLRRPPHMPLAGSHARRGSVPMASLVSARGGDRLRSRSSVAACPRPWPGTEMGARVPEGEAIHRYRGRPKSVSM